MSWSLKSLEQSLLIGSTLVEGSTLTEPEAKSILAGKTVQGHSIHEVRELLNYRTSVEWLIQEVARSPYISKELLLVFHQRLFVGFTGQFGAWKTQENFTYLSDGTRHDYLSPSKVDSHMRQWVEQFNQSPSSTLKKETAQGAALLYYDFQQIHPFEDGNGRIGRIFISYWLHWKTKHSWKFFLKDKVDHLSALEAANRGNLSVLESFFMSRLAKES